MVAPFVPMSIINPSVVRIVDITSQEHDVTVVQRQTGFIARSVLIDEPSRSLISANDAVQRLLQTINDNHPKQFELMERQKQKKLISWIRLYWDKGQKGNTKRWSSHQLKDLIEPAMGFRISNGELKGAMLAAGLAPAKECLEYDANWCFDLERNPRLWSFTWRLLNRAIEFVTVESYFARFNPSRSCVLSDGPKLLTAGKSDSVEIPAPIESYSLSPMSKVYAMAASNYTNGNMLD